MRVVPSILLVALLAMSGPALAATVREMSGSELRKIVSAGQAVSLKRAIDAVSKSMGGEPIEARAFDADGVFYLIVMKRPNGTLFTIIIDAETGKQVSKNSPLSKEISAAATAGAKDKTSKGKSQTAGSNGNAKSSGNSNGGGNSGGNSSGGGNSGGNGGGNSGKKN